MAGVDLSIVLLAMSQLPVLAALLLLGWRQRHLARRRIDELEQALRVYNGAAASVGRHVTALEREVSHLRAALSRERSVPPAAAEPPAPSFDLTLGNAALAIDPEPEPRPAPRPAPNDPEARLLRLLKASGVARSGPRS